MDETLKIDKSRVYLPSSPSNGASTVGKDEFGIFMSPSSNNYGDIHFYSASSWRPEDFPQPRFSSEYGFQGLPFGWKEVTRENESLIDLIDYREHHPSGVNIYISLIQQNLDVNFQALDWEDQVYLSQISQAMALKVETEVYRSGRGSFMNTMGALYWQLNDVWVAPSWSSIEFNGNFKIVHHWMTKVFENVGIIVQLMRGKLLVYGVSDEIFAPIRFMKVTMDFYRFDDLLRVESLEFEFDLKANSVTAVETLDLLTFMNESNFDLKSHFILFNLVDLKNGSKIIQTDFLFPGGFKGLQGVKDPNVKLQIVSDQCHNNHNLIKIEIRIDYPAIFLWISLQHEKIKKIKFSKNGFIQVQAVESVLMTFENENCEEKVKVQDLMVKVMNKFLI